MDTNSKIHQKLDEILIRMTSLGQAFNSTSYQYSQQGNVKAPTHKVGTKDKGIESNTKVKTTENDFSTLHPTIQCNKCQGYGHVAVIYPSPVKVTKVKGPLVTNLEPFLLYCRPLLSSSALVVNHFLLYYQYRSQSELKINKLRKTESES